MAYPHIQSHPRYGPCDSFFVQNDEDIFSISERNRERTRAVAKVAHRKLGHKLSELTALEYQEDIIDHMEFMEGETMPDVNSIDIQTEIQWYMRPYLLDFLIEAHTAFQLLPDTFFLAVNLLDRYCSRRVVYKRHYQLVGCAALLIAAKYGDKKEKVPTVRELRAMCCQLYDEDMFIQMEWHVLQTLNWIIGHPTTDAFLQIALEEEPCEGDMELQHMTWFLCEMALFHKELISTRPSVLARSALALARCILGRPQSQDVTWAGRYDSTIVLSLANHLTQPSQVLSRKYSSITYSSVAQTVEYFLQAQRQQQLKPEPTIQIPREARVEAPTMFSSPHTPQKSYGNTTFQYGMVTPPITPGNEMFVPVGYPKPSHFTPPAYSPTPTPTSDPHMSYGMSIPRYEHQQYLNPHHG